MVADGGPNPTGPADSGLDGDDATSTTPTSDSGNPVVDAGPGGSTASGPCDIFASGGTPCVAAHSTVRALLGSYHGSLYQVTRASDKTTKDVGVESGGTYADSAGQDAFCAGTTCTISIIYDQSGKMNHLREAPGGERKETPDTEADATALKLTMNGHPVYGVHSTPGTGYRDNVTSGVVTGDQPETVYLVTSGAYFNTSCCFDYGNAETDNHADGSATMEAVYFGNWKTEGGQGAGIGPWVAADLENGLFSGGSLAKNPNDPSFTSTYVTGMVIGRSGTFALKGGDAQSGLLTSIYDGPRPAGYNPMKKQGGIVLGIGGDNSPWAEGDFFEGVLTAGAATDATASAVQANIVAAGYGK
jgi:hypothetical protein